MHVHKHIRTHIHTQSVPDAGHPGSVVVGKEPIVLNAGRRGIEISVTNMADRPIQVCVRVGVHVCLCVSVCQCVGTCTNECKHVRVGVWL
jgi:hypothetical protein